jgi:hypothetical protein
VPCENEFERTFGRFLQDAPDVATFAKLPDQFGFAIEYTDAVANLRLYYPDFVARLENGEHWLLETKGQENVDVARKDLGAALRLYRLRRSQPVVRAARCERLHLDGAGPGAHLVYVWGAPVAVVADPAW